MTKESLILTNMKASAQDSKWQQHSIYLKNHRESRGGWADFHTVTVVLSIFYETLELYSSKAAK